MIPTITNTDSTGITFEIEQVLESISSPTPSKIKATFTFQCVNFKKSVEQFTLVCSKFNAKILTIKETPKDLIRVTGRITVQFESRVLDFHELLDEFLGVVASRVDGICWSPSWDLMK